MKDYTSPLNVEYTEKYDDNPRTELLQLITDIPERVFEIGCGAGATGLALKQKHKDMEFIGLELDEKAAQIAQSRLDKVFVANIENADLDIFGLKKEYFDLIICADVLEHLYDPWKTLFILRKYLKPDGKILASFPNIQNINIIVNLVKGDWTYTKHGILDATHLRFFTLNEIVKMFSGTGYKITQCVSARHPELERDDWPINMDFEKIVLKNVTRDEAFRLYVFQYYLMAQKIIHEK